MRLGDTAIAKGSSSLEQVERACAISSSIGNLLDKELDRPAQVRRLSVQLHAAAALRVCLRRPGAPDHRHGAGRRAGGWPTSWTPSSFSSANPQVDPLGRSRRHDGDDTDRP